MSAINVLIMLLACVVCGMTVSAFSPEAEAYAKDIAASVLRAEAAEHAGTLHTTATTALNNYPIVLIPGFLGWNRGELLGYLYFGGIYGDIQQILTNAGYTTYTVAGGPLSSTWDRACEDFAQIKGGIVDYGANHSAFYKHSRFQRTYAGVYPQWGQTNAQGKTNKIHIIAHSEGGQDARILSYLLNSGWANEKNYPYPASAPISPLFTGGHDWISSVVTISTPHDGTTLAASLTQFQNFIRDAVGVFLGLAGAAQPVIQNIYDFKLDQFGLERSATESIPDYINRVLQSSVFNPNTNTDISLYNLSPDGAKQVNINFPPQPQVFYLTYSTLATWQLTANSYAVPDLDMLPIIMPFAVLMGEFTRPASSGLVPIDNTWWPNDGIVNTRSMPGPTLGVAQSEIINYSGTLTSGKFMFMGQLTGWDHLAVIGTGDKTTVVSVYQNIAAFLANNVPVVTSTTALSVQANAPDTPSSNSSGSATPSQSTCQLDALSYSQLCGNNAGTQLVPGLALTAQECQALSLNLIYCNSHYAQTSSAVSASGSGSIALSFTSALLAIWMVASLV